MRRMRLAKWERKIQSDVAKGLYVPVSKKEFKAVADAIKRRRKDKVLTIRINGEDLAGIKRKAKKYGVPYQSYVSELLHRYGA